MKSIGLFLVYISIVFGFISCKKDQEIALISSEENSLTGLKTDTFSIETYSVLSDSIPSTIGSTKFLGSYQSSEMGIISSKIFSTLIPTQIGQTYIENGEILGVNISFSISETYGTPFNQEFDVYQASDSITTGKTYYTKDSIGSSGTLLGSFNLNSKDTGKFEFPLLTSFATTILNQGNSMLASEKAFITFFKGIIIQPKITPGTNTGVMYGISATSIKINVIFKDLASSIQDTISLHQPSAAKTFYQVTKNTIGSSVKSGIDNPSEGNNLFYIQGISGAKAQINFPHLKEWYDNKKIINKASLLLPIQNSSNSEYSKPSVLTFSNLSVSSSTGAQSTFDATNNQYSINIHSVLIPALEAKSTQSYNISVFNTYSHPEQVVLSGSKNTVSKAKLIIYYTNYK